MGFSFTRAPWRLSGAAAALVATGCGTSACPRASADAPRPALAVAPVAAPPAAAAPAVAGTWLFSCCDGAETWVGLIVLVTEGGALHGGFLTDGDATTSSHASYLDGTIEGNRVHFIRRWYTGASLHEQLYTLEYDATAGTLSGTFVEPAFDPAPHRIDIRRGFSALPRRKAPEPAVRVEPHAEQSTELPPPFRPSKGPCDCQNVCRCSGVAPGLDVQMERSRCSSKCRCPVCPPIP